MNATADAYVNASRPKANFGSDQRVKADSSPLLRSYLRFSLAGVDGTIQGARLSLYATAGSGVFDVRGVAATSWSESTLVAGNAPAVASTVTASGTARAGSWITVDVTSLVTGSAPTLAVTASGRDAAFGSRESKVGAKLVLDVAPATASSPPPPAPAQGSRFGLASGGTIEWATDTDLARELDGYRSLGAGWVRFDVKWSVVEQARGSFDWSRYDRTIAAATSRGLDVVANLAYTPAWARPSGADDDKWAPSDPADYARFARAAVARYAPLGVKTFEIWNEPNLRGFWKPAPDAARYTQLLKAAYAEMKQADPSVTVLAGAFSPAGGYHDPSCGNGPTADLNALDFLERMYAAGARGSFDALAHHPYGNPQDTHRCSAWNQMAGTSPSLRSLMVANGDGGKKIWATEFGSQADHIGESEQAAQLAKGLQLWLGYPWAGHLMVYSYKQSLEGYNLVRPDWSPRPAWFAFQNAPKR